MPTRQAQINRRRGVTLRTCQRDRQLRKAPPYTKLGRQIFYRVDALREWMVKNERVTVRCNGREGHSTFEM